MYVMEKIAIVILNWNGKNDTLECLSSLFQLNYPNFEIILVDNGSTDDSKDAILNAFGKKISFIETGENLGFAEGSNVGIIRALFEGAEYILLLNNDTIVDPDLLNAFSQGAKSKPKGGIFGAKIYNYYDKLRLDHMGGVWNSTKGDFDQLGNGFVDDSVAFETMQQVDYVTGCALFFKSSLIQKIGYLEPKFFLMWEESDFCARAKRAGFQIWTAPKAKVWHKISSSFSGKAHLKYFWWRNRLLFIKRNLYFKERCNLYFKILIKEICHLYKLRLLKRLQLWCATFQSKAIKEKKKEQFLIYQASWQGIKDFFLKRFYNSPTIFRKKDTSHIDID